MKTMTGVLTGVTATLMAWSTAAQTAPEFPAPVLQPVAEQVDPTEAIPLVAPAPQLSGAAYDSRLKASLISAQSFQGALDGGWRLSGAGAAYDLQLVDRNDGMVEGAWRDLRRTGAPGGSGFIDTIQRDGASVRMTFDGGRTAVLHPAGGGFAGKLDGRAVTLARR